MQLVQHKASRNENKDIEEPLNPLAGLKIKNFQFIPFFPIQEKKKKITNEYS